MKFNTKKLITILIILCTFMIGDTCNAADFKKNADSTKGRNTIVFGNSTGNCINQGIAAIKDDWIYYRNNNMFGYLYKIKKNDLKGEGTELNEDDVYDINVIGNSIYYYNKSDGYIYEIQTNGSNRKIIQKVKPFVTCMTIMNDHIYFSAGYTNSGYSIYKMNLDGSNLTDLKLHGNKFQIINGKIYFGQSLFGSDVQLEKANLDGSKLDGSHYAKTSLHARYNNYIITQDNCLYYEAPGNLSYDFAFKMTKTNLATGENKVLVDKYIDTLNILDDWIYYAYVPGGSECGLRKVKIDGTMDTQLVNGNIYNINIVGDWIYYLNGTDSVYYRIKTDGSNHQEVN